MSYEEFKKIVKGMRSIYTGDKFISTKEAFDLWYALLGDLPYEAVAIATQKYMLTGKFEPKPAEIRSLAIKVMGVEQGDWSAGWEQVKKAFGRFGFDSGREAIASMDKITGQCVKRLGWKELCTSENTMADRANFRMIYEQLQQRETEASLLPESIKNQIEKLQVKQIGE